MTNIVNVKINKKIITFIILSIFVIFIIFIILNPLHPSMKNYECEYKEKFNEITGAKDKLLEFLKYNVINEDDYNSKVNLFYSRYILILLVLILLVIVCCRL